MYHAHGTLPSAVLTLTRKQFFECINCIHDPETGMPDLEEDGESEVNEMEEAAIRQGLTPLAAAEWVEERMMRLEVARNGDEQR